MFELNSKKSVYYIFIVLVVTFLSLSYLHDIIKMAIFSDFADFGNYYLYSKALRLNYNIYTLDKATIIQLLQEFKMPPIDFDPLVCTLHSPMYSTLIQGITFFEYRLASLLWLVLSHVLLFTSILIILKLIYEKMVDIDRKFIIASSIFLVLSFQPLIDNMYMGQVNPLLLFFLVLS